MYELNISESELNQSNIESGGGKEEVHNATNAKIRKYVYGMLRMRRKNRKKAIEA